MRLSGTVMALILGIIPITVGVVYLLLNTANGDPATAETSGTVDMAGVTMLIALGFAMAFGFAVLLRGARDL